METKEKQYVKRTQKDYSMSLDISPCKMFDFDLPSKE